MGSLRFVLHCAETEDLMGPLTRVIRAPTYSLLMLTPISITLLLALPSGLLLAGGGPVD